jgi:hypothetical protein
MGIHLRAWLTKPSLSLKPPSRATQHVVASDGGVRGDHLVSSTRRATSRLRLLELVESRSVLPTKMPGNGRQDRRAVKQVRER